MDTGAPTLRRVVARWQIVGIALNDVIGSGVYLLPAAAAAILGPASLGAVLVSGLAVLLLVLCFAEASSRFDQPGSAYLYSRTAFGDLVGFEVGWMTWLARVATLAAFAAGIPQALSYLFPSLASGWPRAVAAILPIYVLTHLNVIGVRSGVNAAMVFITAKILPLLLFVAGGIAFIAREGVVGQPPGEGSLGEAAFLLIYAYAGFENTPAAAGEFRRPQRDVPFALILHIVVVTALYAAIQWVALATLPNLGGSETPLADAAGLFLGGWAGWLLTLGAAISIMGTAGSTVLSGPRYLYALSRDGFVPGFLGRVHPRYRTPAAAIVVQSAVALPLALSGSFVALAALSVMARLFTYVGTAASVPVLRRKLAGTPAEMTLPGGPAIPVAAILLSLGLAAGARTANLIAAGVAVAVGFLLYRFLRRSEAGAGAKRSR